MAVMLNMGLNQVKELVLLLEEAAAVTRNTLYFNENKSQVIREPLPDELEGFAIMLKEAGKP